MTLPPPDDHEAYLIAAAINLYLESLRRKASRGLLAPSDIPVIFDIIHAITEHPPAIGAAPPSRELTEEERDRVLSVFGPSPNTVADIGTTRGL